MAGSRLLLTIAVCAVWSLNASGQGAFGWMRTTPMGNLDATDRSLLGEALGSLLEQGKPRDTKTWDNPNNDHGGKITLLRIFQSSDGKSCRQLHFQSRAGGYSGAAQYDLCREPDGAWREIQSGALVWKRSASVPETE